jgi:hypothetical protein
MSSSLLLSKVQTSPLRWQHAFNLLSLALPYLVLYTKQNPLVKPRLALLWACNCRTRDMTHTKIGCYLERLSVDSEPLIPFDSLKLHPHLTVSHQASLSVLNALFLSVQPFGRPNFASPGPVRRQLGCFH